MYFFGIGAMILVGICWTIYGYVMGKAPKENIRISCLMILSAFLAGLVSLVIGMVQGFPQTDNRFLLLALGSQFACGIINYVQLDLMSRAMQKGPNGLVWGIMQSGLIGTFLMGVIFFGEKPAPVRVIGLFLILGGVLAMGLAKDDRSASTGKSWVLFSLGALALSMVTQCCNALPSYFQEMSKNDAASRTLGLYFGGVIGFALTTLPGMIRKRDFGGRGEWGSAIVLVMTNTAASLFFFFRGLDHLARIGCAGLGYPIAIGACVIGFSLYSLLILKEKFPRISLLGLGVVCIGIIVISLK